MNFSFVQFPCKESREQREERRKLFLSVVNAMPSVEFHTVPKDELALELQKRLGRPAHANLSFNKRLELRKNRE